VQRLVLGLVLLLCAGFQLADLFEGAECGPLAAERDQVLAAGEEFDGIGGKGQIVVQRLQRD
jgi:hypothetical protein